jgi:hypothetical protein
MSTGAGATADPMQAMITEVKRVEEKLIANMGITKIREGRCPQGATSPMACMFCGFGHLAECHYPKTCAEARCSHYMQDVDPGDGF